MREAKPSAADPLAKRPGMLRSAGMRFYTYTAQVCRTFEVIDKTEITFPDLTYKWMDREESASDNNTGDS